MNDCTDPACGIHNRVSVRSTGMDVVEWYAIDYVGKYGIITMLSDDLYYFASMIANGVPADAFIRVFLVEDGPLHGRDDHMVHVEDISVPKDFGIETMDEWEEYVLTSHENVVDMVKAGKVG